MTQQGTEFTGRLDATDTKLISKCDDLHTHICNCEEDYEEKIKAQKFTTAELAKAQMLLQELI